MTKITFELTPAQLKALQASIHDHLADAYDDGREDRDDAETQALAILSKALKA